MQKSVLIIWVFLFLFGLPPLAFGEAKPLRLVCDHWPPYQISQEEKLTGFSVSLVDLVFKQMGTSIESLRVYPWKRALSYLEKGQADALFSANFNPARTEFAYYPEEKLIDSPWVLWGKKTGELREIAYSDLANRQIGVVSGYTYTKAFWQFLRTHGNYAAVTSDEQNFKKLAAGRVDYAVAELGNGLFLINKLKLSGIIPFMKHPVRTDGLYIIFNKQTVPKSFVVLFSKTLAGIKQGDEYQALYLKYFSPAVANP